MLSELEYRIMSGRPGSFASYIPLYNQTYNYWKEFWSQVYSSAGAAHEFHKEDFRRQDVIPVILYRGRPIAAHLYSFWSLGQAAAIDHHYFDFFSSGYIEWLKENGASWVMSLEYLTVDSEFRYKKIGFSLGDVLIGLGMKLMAAIGADAALAPARTDVKVDQMCLRFNFDVYKKGVITRNFPVDLMAGFIHRVCSHPDPLHAEVIKRLWQHRVNLSGIESLFPVKTELTEVRVA